VSLAAEPDALLASTPTRGGVDRQRTILAPTAGRFPTDGACVQKSITVVESDVLGAFNSLPCWSRN
jgi:hypothetical protein